MLNYEDIRFDCRLYNGYKPCRYGSACVGCSHYESLNLDTDLSAVVSVVTDGTTGDGLLIIKTGALGDVLRTTSLLPALMAQYPGTPIDWVTAATAVPLLRGNPYLRHIYTLDTREELELLASRRDWHRVYCYEKGDLPLELAGRVGCAFRYGFGPNVAGKPVAFNKASRYALMLGLDDDLKFYKNTKPYSQVICEAAELPYQRSPYVLALSEPAIGVCRALRARFFGKLTVGLNTGCGPVFATKRWTPDAWIRLAQILHQRFPDVNIALLGGKAEAEVNNLIAEACTFVINTGSDNSLEEFCGVTDACEVIVTADSLCMHIGIALKKRVVAVFGSTSDVEIDLFDCGEHVVAQAECRPCFKKACPYSEDEFAVCMKGLDPQIVAEAVERQLAMCSRKVSGCKNATTIMTYSAGVLLLLLVFLGLFFPGRNVLTLSGMNRFQLDNEEGALLYQTLRLAQGKSLYVAPHDMDCVPNVYPPGYFLACAPFVSVESPDLFAGRAVSFGSLIAILLILMRSGLLAVARIRPGPGLIWCCVAPLLITFTYEFARWSNYFRVDMLALALSFGGFALLVTSRGYPSRKRMASALALFLCGFFTKQTMLAAPLAGTLWLAIVHGKRTGVAFGGAFAGCVALLFAGLCAWTGGDFFRLTVLSNTNTFIFADLFVWARHLWFFYKFWIVSAGAVAVGCALFIRDRGLTPWVLYFLCSLPGLAAIGKLGSAENYLLEPLLALALFTVTAIAALMFVGGGRGRLFAFAAVILLIVHFGYRGYQEFVMGLRPLVLPDRQGMAAWNGVANQVRAENRQGRKTWCEPALMNVMTGAPVYYQPFIMSELARQGKYLGQEFTQAIVRKEFAMIVTLCDMEKSPDAIVYLPETVAAVRENYVLREQYGERFSLGALRRLYVYRPR